MAANRQQPRRKRLDNGLVSYHFPYCYQWDHPKMTLLRKRPVVLIADDEHPVCVVTSVHCRLAGYDSVLVENGLQALQATERALFDLIITDYRMPIMDGLEFCRRLRAVDRNQATPVIMCTGSIAELNVSELSKQLGPISFVEKPFQTEYLPKPPRSDG